MHLLKAIVSVAFLCCISVVRTQIVLYKCCNKGEQFDSKVEKCETTPGVTEQEHVWDPVDQPQHQSLLMGLPSTEKINDVIITYAMGPKHRWNVLVNADDQTRWKWGSSGADVWVDSGKDDLRGFTSIYCFEATAEGAPFKRVLLALLANITKCCRKGELLNYKNQCVRQTGSLSNEDPDFEDINFASNDSTSVAEWIPQQLRRSSRMTVGYGDKRFQAYALFPTVSIITISVADEFIVYSNNEHGPALYFPLPMSDKIESVSPLFCFDTILNGRTTTQVMYVSLPLKRIFHKCCSMRERVAPDGSCENMSGNGWFSFTQNHTSDDIYTRYPSITKHAFCRDTSFEIVKELPEAIGHKVDQIRVSRNRYIYTCLDVQRTSDGKLRDVEAYCEWPPSASLYTNIWPLHMLAAALLLAAVAALFIRADMRRSTHGWALASHAVCLMITNILHFISFLATNDNAPCIHYAYSIYFFLLAGAFWLNAVAANMYGFRQPLGALARKGDGGWRRMALLSAYAWGFPVALTTFAVLMDTYRTEVTKKGLLSPEFFETQTCTFFGYWSRFSTDMLLHGVRSLLYYYLPATVLVVANSVCLILTLRKIRELRKDSAFLQSTSRPQRSAVLYVKLLLFTGVVELSLEASALAVILSLYGLRTYIPFTITYQYQTFQTHNIFGIVSTFVDLSRAAAVLWLCFGHWDWLTTNWRQLLAAIYRRCRIVLHSSSGSYALSFSNPPKGNKDVMILRKTSTKVS